MGGGLELKVVLWHHHKHSTRYVTYLHITGNLDSQRPTIPESYVRTIAEPQNKKAVTYSISEARAAQIIDEFHHRRGIVSRVVERDGSLHVVAEFENEYDPKRLPPEFVLGRSAVYAPRTEWQLISLDQLSPQQRAIEAQLGPALKSHHSLQREAAIYGALEPILEPLHALGYRDVSDRGNFDFSGDRLEYRLVTRSGRGKRLPVRVQLSPMTESSLEAFCLDVVKPHPVLAQAFQVFELRMGGFLDEDEAYAAKNHFSRYLRPRKNDVQVVKVTYGRGFDRRDEHFIRVLASPAAAHELHALNKHHILFERPYRVREALAGSATDAQTLRMHFKYDRFGAARLYTDLHGEGDQRLLTQLLYPALHTLDGRPLTATELRYVQYCLQFHLGVMDTEALDYLDFLNHSGELEKVGFGGFPVSLKTGSKYQICSLERTVNLFEPKDNQYRTLTQCADEVELVQTANAFAATCPLLFTLNGDGYDFPMLRRGNAKRSHAYIVQLHMRRERSRAKARAWTPQQSAHAMDQLVLDYGRLNQLRSEHGIEGRLWGQPPIEVLAQQPPFTITVAVDLQPFWSKRNPYRTASNLVAQSMGGKDVSYAEYKENILTAAGQERNVAYLAEDLHMTVKVASELLGGLLTESARTGVGVDRVYGTTQYDNVRKTRIKRALARHHPHLAGMSRREVQRRERFDAEAIQYFRSVRYASKVTAHFHNHSLYYTPVIASCASLLCAEDAHYLLAARDNTTKSHVLTLQLYESWFAPVLSRVYEVLHQHALDINSVDKKGNAVLGDTLPQLHPAYFDALRLHRNPPEDDELIGKLYGVPDFSLTGLYEVMVDTDTRVRAKQLAAQVGPFLVSATPYAQGSARTQSLFYLGSGNILALGEQLIAPLPLKPEAKELQFYDIPNVVFYQIRFKKADVEARDAFIRAAHRAELQRSFDSPLRPAMQRLYDRVQTAIRNPYAPQILAQLTP